MTPEVETVVPILDDGTGPTEVGADVVEVEAETARDAVIIGVRLMHKASPFTGVRAVEYQP